MKKVKPDKGEYGYLYGEKKKYTLRIIIYFLIAVAIFLTGLFLNKFSTRNIFTVAAILVVLPWARAVVGLVTLFPFHQTPKEEHDEVAARVGEGLRLYSDLVITSPEKIMGLQYMVKSTGCILGIASRENPDAKYIQGYLSKGVHNWCSEYQVKIYDKREKEAFLRAIPTLSQKELPEKEEENVCDYLRSLIV